MRIAAVELVAHGVACDATSCERVERLRNAESVPDRWFNVTLKRAAGKTSLASGDLWFCSKECLVSAMTWQLSSLMNPTM
jgi:hypothetical protein